MGLVLTAIATIDVTLTLAMTLTLNLAHLRFFEDFKREFVPASACICVKGGLSATFAFTAGVMGSCCSTPQQ